MPLWICQFTDTNAMLAVREERRPRHQDFLRRHRAQLAFAGPVFPDPEGPPAGALWLVEAESPAAIMRMLAKDPYYEPPHRTVKIMLWRDAMPAD